MSTQLLALLFSYIKQVRRTLDCTLLEFKKGGGELSTQDIVNLVEIDSSTLNKELITNFYYPDVLSQIIVDYTHWNTLLHISQYIQSVPFWEQLYDEYDKRYFRTQQLSSPSLRCFFEWVETLFTSHIANDTLWKQVSELTQTKCEKSQSESELSLTSRKNYVFFQPIPSVVTFRVTGDINSCKSLIWLDEVVIVFTTFDK